jgi:hypothetical protein
MRDVAAAGANVHRSPLPPARQPANPQGAPAHSVLFPPTTTPPEGPSPATIASPPAKRTRKAAKRRCEVELLRESNADDDVLLSPISQARTAPFSPGPFSPAPNTPIESDFARRSRHHQSRPATSASRPEAYVFSTDPDRIVCRKCCNRHYNFRWYSHCFMCNRP